MRKALGPVPLLGLLLLLSMHAWLGLDWISQTTHPGGVDEVTNLNWAYPFHLTWTNHAYDNEAWFLLGREHFLTTPPLIFIASSLLFSATEVSWHNCLTVSLLGFLVWLAAVYLLASRLAGRWAGLVAAALVGSGPMAYLFARTYNTSCLSAALITLAVYAAIASDGFKRLIPSLLVGPLVGLAFISERATPVVALAGPILILAVAAIVHSMREGGFKRVAALESFAAIVALALSPVSYTHLTLPTN